MTDRDPYRDTHRATDPEHPPRVVVEERRGTPWGWIAGGAILALLLLVFAFSTGPGDRTATNTPATQPENTGQAPAPPPARSPAAPSPPSAPAPASPAPPATPPAAQ